MWQPGKPAVRSGWEPDLDGVIGPLLESSGVISPLPKEEDGLHCDESGE